MINWKLVAKRQFRELKDEKKYAEEQYDFFWKMAYALAKAAGVPTTRELHVSCNDMITRALEVLKVSVPEWRFKTHESELDTRLEQICNLMDREKKESKLIKGGEMGRLFFRNLIDIRNYWK